MDITYATLTSRNWGYISPELQSIIKQTRILIAGCGIGSQAAEAAVRTGFEKFILIDGDCVDGHNLNRQFFFARQIGQDKVVALRDNILAINPSADVTCYAEVLNDRNVRDLVNGADLIFDTIDFLDLNAIVSLHDECHRQKKPLVSSFSVGMGAAVISFPPSNHPCSWIREIFSLPRSGPLGDASYTEGYKKLFAMISSGLDPAVLAAMEKVFQEMADGKTCPAPQVSTGAHAVAAMGITAAVRLLGGLSVTSAPNMVVLNLIDSLNQSGFRLFDKQ